jgi:hypothetical protein
MMPRKIFHIFLCLVLMTGSSYQIKLSKTWFKPVTPEMIKARLESSNVQGLHPRLFFSQEDIDRINNLYRQGDPLVKMGVDQIMKEAKDILSKPLLTFYLDEAKLRVPSVHQFASQLPALVMAYRISGDTVFANRAWRQLELMSSFPDWGADRHFLDAGIGAFDFALAYDGLFDFLSSERKSVLRQAVKKHVLTPGFIQLKKRIWWSTAHHNWNGICNGGIIMASLALFEEDPVLSSEIIAAAINALPPYLQSFDPDGQSEEGLMYWSYGLMYTTITIESIKRTMGTVFELDQFPGFKKTGWFPAYVSGPVTSLNIGDDPIKNERSKSFFWFAYNYKDTALAQLQYDLCEETKKVSWMDLLYYDPSMCHANKIERKISSDIYIRGIEVMSSRTGWKRDDWFVSMHGGYNNANHGHLDAGTFDIQALGEVWAYGNLGRDDYTSPGYFSKQTIPGYLDIDTLQSQPGRWHFYRLRAEGKNCLVFNPSIRPDQDEKGNAQLLRSGSIDKKGFFILDLSNCYSRDVKRYHRGIQLDRINSTITIQDEWESKDTVSAWWQMHTRASIRLSEDKRTAFLKQNGKEIMVFLSFPAKASFEILKADYIPGRSFPLTKNSANDGFKKLVVHLTKKASAITVQVAASNSLPDKQNIPLHQW